MRRTAAIRGLLVVTATTAVLTAPGALAAPGCPAAKTCATYELSDLRWPSEGAIVVDYLINPDQPWFTPAETREMVSAAVAVWERANPRIDLRFRGFTTAKPTPGDGRNVIGWDVIPFPLALAAAPITSDDDVISEVDLALDPAGPWGWERCEQRDGACGGWSEEIAGVRLPWSDDPIVAVKTLDAQSVITHELGHWFGLDHPADDSGDEQTMVDVYRSSQPLAQQTLALGDILGVRKAYPCGRCGGKPVVYAP